MIGNYVLDDILSHNDAGLYLGYHIKRVHLGDNAFDLSDVGFQLCCDEIDHVVGDLEVEKIRLALNDRETSLVLRGADVRRKAGREPCFKSVGNGLDLLCRAVRCKYYRLVELVQLVEYVEELFLGLLFAGDELDIVYQQRVGVAVFFVKKLSFVCGD